MILEILSPSFYFLWLGLAAAAVGVLKLLLPHLGFTAQLAWFAAFVLGFVFLWKAYLKKNPLKTESPHLNDKMEQMIGKTGHVVEAIIGGKGRVSVGDTTWIAVGPDCPEHARIKVTGHDDGALKVEKD